MIPQIIVAVLMLISLFVHAIENGKLKYEWDENFNFGLKLMETIVIVSLLCWGGFWDPLLGR